MNNVGETMPLHIKPKKDLIIVIKSVHNTRFSIVLCQYQQNYFIEMSINGEDFRSKDMKDFKIASFVFDEKLQELEGQ